MKLTKKEKKLLKELIYDWEVMTDITDDFSYAEPTPSHLQDFAKKLKKKLK